MEEFEPIGGIPIDPEHAVEQNTAGLQTLRDGLPELVKNAKDQYSRLGIVAKEERQVVVLFSSNWRHVGVLDFAGARGQDFASWLTWDSRLAGRAHLADDIEAGHGNGGKGFMARGGLDRSFMFSSCDGLANQMGFDNTRPEYRYQPGFFRRNGELVRDLPDPNPEWTLAALLSELGCSAGCLPQAARSALSKRKAFTLVVVRKVTDLDTAGHRRRYRAITAIEDLRQHPQAAMTLESCTVWAIHGDEYIRAEPLSVLRPPSRKGFEERRYDLPETLPDPETGLPLEVRRPTPQYLLVNVSEQNLRWGQRRPMNVVRVRNARNVIANWSIGELVPSPGSSYLYGELRVECIDAGYQVGTERDRLADVPIVAAIRHWVADKLREVAEAVEGAATSRDSDEERARTNELLQKFRALMRQHLEASGGGPGRGDGPLEPPPRVFGKRCTDIRLEEEGKTIFVPTGTCIPLKYSCWDRTDPNRPLPVPNQKVKVQHLSGEIVLEPETGVVFLPHAGTSTLCLVTSAGVRSNPITIHSVDVDSISVRPPATPLKQGERFVLQVLARSSSGVTLRDLLYDMSIEPSAMGRISRSGTLVAGGIAGDATVRICFGPGKIELCNIRVSEEKAHRQAPAGGAGVPLILLCGTHAPGTEEFEERERTVKPMDNLPTIIDYEPAWQNRSIIWVNQGSAEAMQVRKRGGLRGKTFSEFLALKCFEIVRRLKARALLEGAFTWDELLNALARAEVETSGFLQAAYGLVRNMWGNPRGDR